MSYILSDMAYDAIEEINRASGTQKQVILRNYPGLTPYLYAAYNPFTRYYMTTKVLGQGNFQFEDMTWELLDLLSKRALSGNKGQHFLDTAVMGLTPKSAELLKRILKKDLRMGMGAKTINKVFPGLIPTHDVMLAKLFDKRRVKFPCFTSPKIDGVRAIYRKGKFFSRNGHEYTGLSNLVKILQPVGDMVIDGELCVRGKSFQEGSGLIRRDEEVPLATFHPFDLPESGATFIERLTNLHDLISLGPEFVVPVHHEVAQSHDDIIDFYQVCRNMGFEGAVVKPYDYVYKGTRSYDWMKMKDVLSADLEVVGSFEGEGKYVGMLGGIIVDFRGTEVRVGSGFSDRTRESLWEIREYLPGRIAEVLYMEVTDTGSLRHPRFVTFRPDKESTYGGI
jgi:DNA ligase-1